MSLLERAITIALDAHRGQFDRNGRPYILHPLHVMMQMDTVPEKIAAVLHDVIEDSEMTLDDLRNEGFSEEVLSAVDLMTHDKDQTPYDDYVRRLKPNAMARKIKLADLQHNMDMRRMDKLGEADFVRFQKYLRAWHILTD
jgi:(p)ppGpp synthase/HD superfamily hydrolase